MQSLELDISSDEEQDVGPALSLETTRVEAMHRRRGHPRSVAHDDDASATVGCGTLCAQTPLDTEVELEEMTMVVRAAEGTVGVRVEWEGELQMLVRVAVALVASARAP